MVSCPYCNEVFEDAKRCGYHKRCCTSNPSRHTPSNQYLKAKELGLAPWVLSKESRAKIGRKGELNSSTREEVRAKISKTCLEKSARGEWHTSLAKRMHYDYNGVDLHGKWELEYAKYLDRENINWERCKHRFAYEFEGKTRWYTPDFYLIDSKTFVEIKGYETEKDRAKWSQFPVKLVLLHGEDLLKIGLDVEI